MPPPLVAAAPETAFPQVLISFSSLKNVSVLSTLIYNAWLIQSRAVTVTHNHDSHAVRILPAMAQYHQIVFGHHRGISYSYLLPKFEDFVPTSLGSGAISTRQKCVTVTADYCRLTYKYVLSAAVTSKPDEPCRCEITYAEDSNGRWFSESCLARAQQVSSIEMGKYDYQSRASEASEALVAWNGDNLATHLLN